MNRLFTVVPVLLCCVMIGTADVKALCPEKMISYWELNEDNPAAPGFFVDIFGNDATCQSNCPEYETQGIIEQAQVFDKGSDTGIEVDPYLDIQWGKTGNFSIEAWIKATKNGESGTDVIVGRTTGGGAVEWFLGFKRAGLGNPGVATFYLQSNAGDDGVQLNGISDILDGNWHHLIAVRDGDNRLNMLYVDGVLERSKSATYQDSFVDGSAMLTIGYFDKPTYFHATGTIDEVALYSKALPENEILQHYLDGFMGLRWGYCSGSDPIRIMPLGDSITRGTLGVAPVGDLVGYRRSLYKDLDDAGQDGHTDYNVDFVGGEEAGGNVPEVGNPDFDIQHEGHGGAMANEIAGSVGGYLSNNPADVVLLHIGTNDISLGQNYLNIVNEVEDILDAIDSYDTDIPVVLARIINRFDPLSVAGRNTTRFNDALQAMADSRGDRVLVVDHENALTYPLNMIDEVHPNSTGYGCMADVWYDGLVTFLPPTHIAPPVITSTPKLQATLNKTYIYKVEADGNEPPQFMLAEPNPLPNDMEIDPTTGVISWTPDTEEIVNVVVEATNPRGTDSQAFTITAVKGDNSGGSNGSGSTCFIGSLEKYDGDDDNRHPVKDISAAQLLICLSLMFIGIIRKTKK